jgi:uncharacterized membrane protein
MTRRSQSRLHRFTCFTLAGLFGLFVVLAASMGSPKVLVPVAGLAVCALAAGVLRLGWMIPAALVGVLFGFLSFPAMGSDIYADTLDWAIQVAICALFGLIFGLIVDTIRSPPGYSSETDGDYFD